MRLIIIILALALSLPAKSFNAGIEATIFNVVAKNMDLFRLQLLVDRSNILYGTLSSEEKSALVGNNKIKIARYMYLIDYWQDYTLEEILAGRGLIISRKTLSDYRVDEGLFRQKLIDFSSLEMSANDQCKEPTNKLSKKTYFDVYSLIEKLENIAIRQKNNDASLAALTFLKSFYYIRLHSPVATHTYTNSQCISDLSGMLSCADTLVEKVNASDEKKEMVEAYDRSYFLQFQLQKNPECSISLYQFIKSGAMLEPISSTQVAAAGEVLLINLDGKTISRSKKAKIQDILKENKLILQYAYTPNETLKSFAADKPVSHASMLQDMMFNRMKITALRLIDVLNADKILAGNSSNKG